MVAWCSHAATSLPYHGCTRTLTVALVGNPNTGKTTLFNALSGLRQRVGNYPGVTVEMKKGTARDGDRPFDLIDLPGTYSLAARSPDEMVAVDLLLGQQPGEPRPDVVVTIVDASNLDRNLYLVTQLLELGVPVVVALNMIDVAAGQGCGSTPTRLGKQARRAGRADPGEQGPGLDRAAAGRLGRRRMRKPSPSGRRFPEPFEQRSRDAANGARPGRRAVPASAGCCWTWAAPPSGG